MVAERGWCTYTIDSRGHGESDWSAEANYSLQDFALDLISIADAVGSNPVIVGASLGGLTSLLAMGRERPGLGRGLVLVDIVPEMEQAGTDRIGAFMMRHVETGFASLHEAAVAVAEYSPRPGRTIDPDSLRKNLRERDGRWYWHWDPRFMSSIKRSNGGSEVFAHEVLTECARAIDVPKLLVRGRMSDVVTEEAARRFVAAVPGTGYVDIADAAHGCRRQERRVSVGRARLPRRTRLISAGRRTGRRSRWRRSRRRVGPRQVERLGDRKALHAVVGEHDDRSAVEFSGRLDLGEHIAHAGIGVANGGVEDLRMRPTGVPAGVGEVEREPAVAGERPELAPPDMQSFVAGVGVVDRCIAELLHPHEVLGAVQTAVGVGGVGIGPFVVIWAYVE